MKQSEVEGFLERLHAKPQARPGHYIALCPAHDDREPSLSVAVEKDRILVHCFAGCTVEEVCEALGIKVSDLFIEPDVPPQPLTLDKLAEVKRFPKEFLISCGVGDSNRKDKVGVRIPYRDKDGKEKAIRYRHYLEGNNRFSWRQGDALLLYGLWKLDEWRRQGLEYVVLVEGESDCWTLWYHGIPALGIPGKTTWKPSWKKEVEGFNVYLWVEPDAFDLAQKVARDIPHVKLLSADEWKDPSELHIAGKFTELWPRIFADAMDITEYERRRNLEAARQILEEVRDILEGDPIAAVEAEIRKMGYGGDTKYPLLVYLALTSRLLALRTGQMPVHLFLRGLPASGKSFTVNTALRLMPQEAFVQIDAASPRALIYSEAPLRHRAVIFSEMDSIPQEEDSPATSAIRNLAQEGRMIYEVVVKDEGGRFMVERIEKDGPTVLLSTGTRNLPEQLGTRFFILDMPDDHQHIVSILDAQAKIELGHAGTPAELLIKLQKYLQYLAPWDVIIPFASELSALVAEGAKNPRITRDFNRLLSLIKAVALLRHRKRRSIGGVIVADLEDYATVYQLARDLYEASVSEVPADFREIVNMVEKLKNEGVTKITITLVAKRLGKSVETTRRKVKKLIAMGWLVNSSTKKTETELDIGDPLPESIVLPTPEMLRRRFMPNEAAKEPIEGTPAPIVQVVEAIEGDGDGIDVDDVTDHPLVLPVSSTATRSNRTPPTTNAYSFAPSSTTKTAETSQAQQPTQKFQQQPQPQAKPQPKEQKQQDRVIVVPIKDPAGQKKDTDLFLELYSLLEALDRDAALTFWRARKCGLVLTRKGQENLFSGTITGTVLIHEADRTLLKKQLDHQVVPVLHTVGYSLSVS